MNIARHFLSAPTQTGAVSPASTALASMMVSEAAVDTASVVVELGPGTGSVTQIIVSHLPPGSAFFAIELNKSLASDTRRRCPGVTVYDGDAVDLQKFIKQHRCASPTAIISSIPWTLLKDAEQLKLLDIIHRSLSPDGLFVTYAYVGIALSPPGRRFRQHLAEFFPAKLQKRTVWHNLPPAHVYTCRKQPIT